MIIGIGIDLVELDRLKELMSDRFIDRILSVEEKKLYENIAAENTKLSFIGGRFASKEAIFKAISKGPGKTNYIDFSVLNDESGKPYVKTDFFKEDEIIHISITHTDSLAIAYVMIEKL
ncbi:MAG TPA: holo-[acyl-carrier-protein] synthase [Acholeplasmataceae bacterium]|nr:MAG: Holo-[acyl-carrier-protein] synthase [Microgenomates group bacterium GW2011_GWC1_39_12]OHE35359.1 MAG: holo-[acyl-carrier-protein] synthase [Tenericutes bacterium GWE2_38_8]HBG32291.1 holo-[acyl-carrier-protein] synthase [Acholeplasmataceae bacterium]HBY65661.1 holo-[acyl-carrier-protein] synthase [Acholeplasmataceae bacterium]HCB67151.1 holo-[acyl-carrier-protein] synthase [Acholeplasmataceae bacterium]